MLITTLNKYQTRARNFYRDYCAESDPSSAQICAALLARAPSLVPGSFGVLKSALFHDQIARGHETAAQAIRQLVNPVTATGSTLARKPKLKRIRSVGYDDFKTLLLHLDAKGYTDEMAAIILAYYIGIRPCEMRDITLTDNCIHIIGGKKNSKLERGADRSLLIKDPKILKRIKWALNRMNNCQRSNAAIRDRLRKECRELWPRRKMHPTLKSFRHQLGSNLKASGESPENIAYIMGHQSTDSASVYGNPRSGAGGKVHIRPAHDSDLSKIRTPKQSPGYVGKVVAQIEFTAATRGNWVNRMAEKMVIQRAKGSTEYK